jgi:predicted lipoprotein with Yx(FWY)xxD motif
MNKDGVGAYIADAKGMTLYYFAKDSAGKSVCAGDCLAKWPAYAANKVEPQAGLEAKDFTNIKREDGASQVTYKGYPLYYFAKDQKPGDTTGQGVGGVWYVVDPAAFPPKK